MRNGKITCIPASKISPEVDEEYKRTRLAGDELLITLVGNPGESVIVEPEMKGWNAARALAVLRLKDPNVRKWLNLVLNSKPLKHIIDSRLNTTVQKTLNLKDVKELPIPVPNEGISEELYRPYYDLDNKITLNRQINQTLEHMAQALFKSWFVDFDPVVDNALDAGFFEHNSDLPEELLRRAEQRKIVRQRSDFTPLPAETRQLFPAAFEACDEPSLGLGGWVPKGWACSPLNAFINLIGGGTPKTSEESFWGGDIPWFSVVDAPNDSDVFVLKTEKYITEAGLSNSSAKLLRVGTTIISARGTVGKCALVGTPMAMNQSCYGINGIDGVADNFVYFMVRHLVSQLRQRSHGSVFNTITRDTFNSLKFIFPNVSLNDAFKDQTANWFERIHINNRQLSVLQDLRDTLLPKLIAGELRLNDNDPAVDVDNND
ncbi:restriction modification system DNA specificity protein-containing protein [Edwardsiella piscicida C07-087]|nr:restriction modification system DNA specificity protein-containing protein [Edwardsiella piscicida C07-087]